MKRIWHHCHCRPDISLLAAGALGEEEKFELERHLGMCEECRTYYAEIKSLTAPLAEWEKNLTSIVPTPAAQQRWARAVQAAAVSSASRPGESGLGIGTKLWRIIWGELVWPSRYAWSGLAALWVAMLVINSQLSSHPTTGAGDRAASSEDMMQAWEEQNRVLALLIQTPAAVPAPPPSLPRPRSRKEQDWAII